MDNIQQKSIWPGWETVRLIGRGSYGAVYEVRRRVGGTEERAAVKCLSIPRDRGEIRELRLSGYDQESLTRHFTELKDRIRQEYETMVRLKGSDNIVACEDLRIESHADGIGWDIAIRMELLTPLLDSLDERADESRVLRLAQDMARALTACHRENIVHRDVKPQNIFVDRQGRYKLGDFGVARTMEGTGSATMRTGTYRYMAPEVFNGQHYGPRADLYSLGLVLYWLLNDRRSPFVPPPPHLPRQEDEELARARRFAGEPILPPSHGSRELQRIVLKLLAFDPKGRYQNAEELLRELNELNCAAAGVRNSVWENDRRTPAPAGAIAESPADRSLDSRSLARDDRIMGEGFLDDRRTPAPAGVGIARPPVSVGGQGPNAPAGAIAESPAKPGPHTVTPVGADVPGGPNGPSPHGGRRQPPSRARRLSDEGGQAFPAPPKQSRRRKGVVAGLAAGLAAALLLVLALVLIPRLSGTGKDKPAELTPTSTPTDAPTLPPEPGPSPTPAPTPSPTAGISTAGTEVKAVVYTDAGKVKSLCELLNGEWVDWVYVYDDGGAFRYRYRNIGALDSVPSNSPIPGTDTTFSILNAGVQNCVGFTLDYEVTEVLKGDALGPRYLYLRSGESWIRIGEFKYPTTGSYHAETFDFRFNEPITFDAFGTPRVYPDDSMFRTVQTLKDVLVADYAYVSLDGSAADAEPVWEDTDYSFTDDGDNGDIDWGDGWDDDFNFDDPTPSPEYDPIDLPWDPTPTPDYDPEPVWEDPAPTPDYDPEPVWEDPAPPPAPTQEP